MRRLKNLLFVLLSFTTQSLLSVETNSSTTIPLPKLEREFRGVWVATVANIDWPSEPGLSADKQKEEFIAILEQSAKLRLNAIILQVRPACDALYRSDFEPWSEYLSGTLGKAPEPAYDPLQFAIDESHKRGMELHAWINPYRAGFASSKAVNSTNHISKTHPELVVKYGKHLWLEPSKEEVQSYVMQVIMDIVKRYDIDGLHMDDYFYPYPEKNDKGDEIEFPDDDGFLAYVGAGGFSTRDDWRRENVNTLIEGCYKAIKAEKPWVKFGVSPFGIWQPGFPASISGMNSFQEIYCDSLKWLTNGWMDYIAPQLYWKIEAPKQSYPTLLKWWSAQNTRGRHIWPGNFTSRVDGQWTADEIINQIKVTREQLGDDAGNIHFSMAPLSQNRGGITDDLAKNVYTKAAAVPASPWLGGHAPGKPTVSLERQDKDLKIHWEAPASEKVWQWVLQKRVAGEWTTEILPADKTALTLKTSGDGKLPDVVAVVALNRYGVASSPAIAENKP
jgi:uncharacterized lipoprotein YddW (UPF0748 family)